MSPSEIIFCIQAISEYSPEHISDENWQEILHLVEDVNFKQVDDKDMFLSWLYKDTFPQDTD